MELVVQISCTHMYTVHVTVIVHILGLQQLIMMSTNLTVPVDTLHGSIITSHTRYTRLAAAHPRLHLKSILDLEDMD